MKLAIGSDHAGFELKEFIKSNLEEMGYEVIDVGTHSEERCDYSDYSFKVVKALQEGQAQLGILICGTGQGMAMSANKFKGIRASLCWDVTSARLARAHNNANVLAMGGRLLGKELAMDIVKTWLTTEFEGGRHQRRIDKFSELGSEAVQNM